MSSGNIVKETVADCTACKGRGVQQIKAGCAFTRCLPCQGKGFFFVTISRERLGDPSGVVSRLKPLLVGLALLCTVVLGQGCATSRPMVCLCPVPVADVRVPQLLGEVDRLRSRLQMYEDVDTLEDAADAAKAVAK